MPTLSPLELVTAPTAYPVSVDEVKAQVRQDEDRDDGYIERLIQAATSFCEQEVSGHRQFITATYDVRVDGWWDDPICLPRPPLSSVTSVKYRDIDNVEQTLSASVYLVRTKWRQPGTIELAPDQEWPDVSDDYREPIVIRFVAGYGATAASVPQTIRHAIIMTTSHWYENRVPVVSSGAVPKEVPMTVRALLDSEGYGSYS